MKNVQTYRAMSSICRQRAVFDRENSGKHLGMRSAGIISLTLKLLPTSGNATPQASTDIATSDASST